MNIVAGTRPFQQDGRTGAIVRLSLTNFLLNVVTLSLWRFWGKTKVRQELWRHTWAWGDPLEYTGTGRELFLGFLVALLGVFLPWMLLVSYLQTLVVAGQQWVGALILVMNALLMFLAGAGLYRARRYQLSRTVWRGIRGGQSGEAWRYGLLLLFTGIGVALSLGWALPWAQMKLARYEMENTLFGDQSFTCEAVSRPLYKRFAVVWLTALASPFVLGVIAMPMAGISSADTSVLAIGGAAALALCLLPFLLLPYAWYRAGFYAELARNTRFAGANFAFQTAGWDLVWLVFNNALLSLLTLGILKPVAALRVFRFTCQHLQVVGEPAFDQLNQGAKLTTRTGEGLAAVFDGAGEF